MKTLAQRKCGARAMSALGALLLGSLPVSVMAQEERGATLPQVIDADAARLELLLAALRGGQVTVEAAWQRGDLSVDDVVEILSTRLNDWGGFEWGKDEAGLRRALAKVLAEHGGERLKTEKLSTLPPKVRLWLADYFQSVKDPRTVEITEGILSEVKAPVRGNAPLATPTMDLVFQAIERLAWFYRSTGEPQKGAEAWLRLKLYANAGWWVPDSMLEAARLYARMGAGKKAKELYAEVPQHGNGWLTGLALADQASVLIEHGQHEEARKLLQQPVTGEGAEQIKVAILARLGHSYYRTDEWELAYQYSQKAVEQYESLPISARGRGLEAMFNTARSTLEWMKKWPNQRLICEPHEFIFVVRQGTMPLPRRFRILSFRAIPLTVEAGGNVQARLLNVGHDTLFFHQQEIEVAVAPEATTKSFDATVVVSSPQFPGYQVRVPVHVRAQSPSLFEPSVFFGFVKAGEAAAKTWTVSATKPFRILRVETGDDSVQAQPGEPQAATKHSLQLRFSSLKKGYVEGKLRVVTDLPNQEVIEVLYVARVE